METEINAYEDFELYESVLDRMAKQAFELRSVRQGQHDQLVLFALLINCESLVSKKIECKFLQSKQFCIFLLSMFYDLTSQIPDTIYKLLERSMINEENTTMVLQFIEQ